MIKKIIAPLILALGLGSAVALAAETPATTAVQPATQAAEMFNPMAFMGMNAGAPNTQQMNLARPQGYQAFMNPMNYGQFMHPSTYAQFMSPQFYMQFADPNNMMAWMNPNSYSAYMNPASYMQMMNPMAYMQFMNPGVYMQGMNPASYQAFMNPNTYMQWMNPASYNMSGASTAAYTTPNAGFNMFDPNAWSGMTAPQAPTQAQPEQPAQQ